jgi:hypothetical protein
MTNGDGIKTVDSRYGPARGRITELHYDTTGQFVVAIRGVIPSDVDLPHGWGDPINGLACGIVLTRERGRLGDIKVSLNLKSSRAMANHCAWFTPECAHGIAKLTRDPDSRGGGASPRLA